MTPDMVEIRSKALCRLVSVIIVDGLNTTRKKVSGNFVHVPVCEWLKLENIQKPVRKQLVNYTGARYACHRPNDHSSPESNQET
jgi:hypothetical protein